MPSHSLVHVVGIFAVAFCHIAAYMLYMFAANKSGVQMKLVKRRDFESLALNRTEITPDHWSTVIWQIIFPLQISWLFNFFHMLCRTCDGKYFYERFSPFFFLFFSLGSLFHIARVLTLGNDYFLASFFLALVSAACMIAACVLITAKPGIPTSYAADNCCDNSCAKDGNECNTKCKKKSKCAFIGYRINLAYMMNAVGAYAAYAAFTVFVELAIVLVYYSSVNASSEDAATGCLVVILLFIGANIGLDLTLLERYNRFQFGTYVFEVLALACVLSERNVPGSRNTILTIIVMCWAIACVLAKAINCTLRELKAPKQGMAEKSPQVYPVS